MKNNYLAVSTVEDGKRLAYVLKVLPCENLLHVLQSRPNVEFVNICESKREAQEVANAWNQSYWNNGTYFFSKCLFPASIQNA